MVLAFWELLSFKRGLLKGLESVWVAHSYSFVVLLRGEEELSRQPAVGEPAEVTVTVLAGREDHLANFSCRTELDLRPGGLGLFQNSSAPRQLQTFGEALGSRQRGWAQGFVPPWGARGERPLVGVLRLQERACS